MQNKFNTTQDWLAFDRAHLWHPYTSMHEPLPCYPIVGAEGVYLKTAEGKKLIDGMSSWWCALHGYNQDILKNAAYEQIETMPHVMFGGIAHQPAAELAVRLIEILPKGFEHIFLADSGSIAIEVALKMALQYWQSAQMPQKNTLLTVRGGYHGDPFSCMSVSDPENGQHHLFPRAITKHLFAPRPKSRFDGPWDEEDLTPIQQSLERHHNDIAALIIEPVVQGAGGMWFYHPAYLRGLRRLCDDYNVLLIFDEIATGFGRTGEMFAMSHAEIIPDIVCVGKALTGGMMSLAATVTTPKVAMAISQGAVPILMHGPTFMGNPLACAIACASIDLLTGQQDGSLNSSPLYPKGWRYKVQQIERGLQSLHDIADHKGVSDVRILGAIGVIEMEVTVDVGKLQKTLVSKNVWVRPFGKLIYIMPPYIIEPEELQKLCGAIIETIRTHY